MNNESNKKWTTHLVIAGIIRKLFHNFGIILKEDLKLSKLATVGGIKNERYCSCNEQQCVVDVKLI